MPDRAFEVLQSGHQTRHTDGETGCGNGLTHEAGNEAIVTATATDGAEYDLFAFFIGDIECQFSLVDWAGVIFETTDNGRIDLDARCIVTGT